MADSGRVERRPGPGVVTLQNLLGLTSDRAGRPRSSVLQSFEQRIKVLEQAPTPAPTPAPTLIGWPRQRTGETLSSNLTIDRVSFGAWDPYRLRAGPFYLPAKARFDRLGVFTTTTYPNTGIILALYNDDGNGYPGKLLVEAPELDCSTKAIHLAPIDAILDPGVWWMVMLCNNSSIGMYHPNDAIYISGAIFREEAEGNHWTFPRIGWVHNDPYSYGPLPDKFPEGAECDRIVPIPIYRIAEYL